MSEPRLSPATRALLRAARAYAPSDAARAKVWSAVASTAGAAAAGAGGTASTPPGVLGSGAASASKMIALGTLLGGTVTVGLATLLLRLGAVPDNPPPSPPAVAVFAAAPAGTGARTTVPVTLVEPPSPAVVDLTADPVPAGPPVFPSSATAARGGLTSGSPPVLLPRTATAAAATPPPHGAASSRLPDDALAQEASLVARAHAALVGGDPRSALRAVGAARRVPSHVLGPEELSIEAQALRALGRDDQAKNVDSTLRRLFPESALAR